MANINVSYHIVGGIVVVRRSRSYAGVWLRGGMSAGQYVNIALRNNRRVTAAEDAIQASASEYVDARRREQRQEGNEHTAADWRATATLRMNIGSRHVGRYRRYHCSTVGHGHWRQFFHTSCSIAPLPRLATTHHTTRRRRAHQALINGRGHGTIWPRHGERHYALDVTMALLDGLAPLPLLVLFGQFVTHCFGHITQQWNTTFNIIINTAETASLVGIMLISLRQYTPPLPNTRWLSRHVRGVYAIHAVVIWH